MTVQTVSATKIASVSEYWTEVSFSVSDGARFAASHDFTVPSVGLKRIKEMVEEFIAETYKADLEYQLEFVGEALSMPSQYEDQF